MAGSKKNASAEDWNEHIFHMACGYSGRNFNRGYFNHNPQMGNRIYEEWLRESGLPVRQDKSRSDLEIERKLLSDQREAYSDLIKIKNRPLEFLRKATDYEGPLFLFQDDQLSIMAKRLLQAKPSLQEIEGFFDMLQHLDRRSKFLWADPLHATGAQTWLDPLIRLWHRRGQWRRAVKDWKPKSHNRERQFASLLRHLLAEYDVPNFMDTVWLRNDRGSARFRDAWVHVGSGNNIRTAKGLPMVLSKKGAHILSSAPEELSFEHAFKWAHMQTFDLRPRTCAALLGSRWGGDFNQLDFWDSVLRFFSVNPMISPDRIGPIVDFIYSQKFEGPVILIDGDEILRDDPPHPGFSMRGRQGQTLLQLVENWHRELARTELRRGKGRKAMDAIYCKSGWKSLTDTEKLNDAESSKWQFVEILTEIDLHDEGRKMRHCIYSFHARVSTGRCSIWSLRTTRKGGPHHGKIKHHLTIEVSSTGRVNEARGYGNALPIGRGEYLLRKWATLNRMSIAPYVFM